MTMRQSWIPASGCCGFGSIPRSPCAPFKKGQEVGAEGSFRNLCQTYSRQQHSTAKIKLGCQLLISVTVLSSDPSPLWTLLLCVHIISHLAGATHVPQATSAATASAGIAKDPSPSRPLMPPTAQQCPALEVTWPEVEVPLNGTLTLSCTACSRFPHFSILYWLGNGSFIERLPGRLWEGSTRRERRGTRTQLWRALVLEELSPALRSTNFSCVFSDPAQTAQRHLILAQLSNMACPRRECGKRGTATQKLKKDKTRFRQHWPSEEKRRGQPVMLLRSRGQKWSVGRCCGRSRVRRRDLRRVIGRGSDTKRK
ncbi:interleukin-18-binding protein isoform X5 [Camelus dromedarius]|uniref:interleukin-18-binding protein isoform X5 n=1 Tax=Camelus dromedarius TaxID=9838 RepID=UPI00311976A2